MKQKRWFFVLAAVAALVLIFTGCFAEDQFVPGVRTDKDYVNESLGIRIDLDENFVMATDEEIWAMMQAGLDMLNNDDLNRTLSDISNISVYYDMMAANLVDGSSIQIISEKPVLSGMTIKQYVDSNKNQLKPLNAEIIEEDVVEVCGIEYNGMYYTMDYSGVKVSAAVYMAKVGDRFVLLQFTGLSEESIENASRLVSCISR